jgi:hypothetical protein
VYYRTNLTIAAGRAAVRLLARDGLPGIQRLGGTLTPVRDRKVGASSRSYRFSANGAVIDADTNLLTTAARLVPGSTAAAKRS